MGVLVVLAAHVAWRYGWWPTSTLNWTVISIITILVTRPVHRRIFKARNRRLTDIPRTLAKADDPFARFRGETIRSGGGAFLGWMRSPQGARLWRSASSEAAVLVLAPPRAGKTTGIIIPSVLAAPAAVVVTSTKRDVLDATVLARTIRGTCWLFDPSGHETIPPGVQRVRWSPIASATTWDSARLVARSMIGASISTARSTDTSGSGAHFADKASDLLAPLLYAARQASYTAGDVADWLYTQDLATAAHILDGLEHDETHSAGARIGNTTLASILNLDERERSGVWSTAQRVMSAYQSTAARELATEVNFDPATFAAGADTLYVTASDEIQAQNTPIVVGLLTAIKEAVYNAHRFGQQPWPLTMLLDETANIAPIEDLPRWLSTAGGNGLHLVIVLQDLSQAALRWGRDVASGLLTLCNTKIVLGGIGDLNTLRSLSAVIGTYDRQVATQSTSQPRKQFGMRRPAVTVSQSISTVRTPILSESQIAQLPQGTILMIEGPRYGYLELAHFHDQQGAPWLTAIQTIPSRTSLQNVK